MSLAALASLIVRAGQNGRCTPALVVPSSLSLKRRFFVALCDELIIAYQRKQVDRCDSSSSQLRDIQIDWVRGRGGLWSVISDPFARKWGDSIAAQVSVSCAVPCQFHVCSAISRPSPQRHTLVVGLTDTQVALSPWTHPLYLHGSSNSSDSGFLGEAARTPQQHEVATT